MVFPSTGLASASVGFYERKLQSSMAASCQRRHSWCSRALVTFSISRSVTPYSRLLSAFSHFTFIRLLYKSNPILTITRNAPSRCSDVGEKFDQENINRISSSKRNVIVSKGTVTKRKKHLSNDRRVWYLDAIVNVGWNLKKHKKITLCSITFLLQFLTELTILPYSCSRSFFAELP